MSKNCVLVIAGLVICQALCAQKLQLGTNALGWMTFGTINLQGDYAVQRHWSVGLNGKYNPFIFEKDGGASQMQLKQASLAASARWWPWHVFSGWWVCGKLQWQVYNMGGVISEKTEEGHKYGAGLSAGYTYMINRHWNMEFGLGMWGGMKNYTVYSCPKCGTRESDGIKSFILPNDIMISVAYVF